jgi:hypothetical protein
MPCSAGLCPAGIRDRPGAGSSPLATVYTDVLRRVANRRLAHAERCLDRGLVGPHGGVRPAQRVHLFTSRGATHGRADSTTDDQPPDECGHPCAGRAYPLSKNSDTITPRPEMTFSATSRCQYSNDSRHVVSGSCPVSLLPRSSPPGKSWPATDVRVQAKTWLRRASVFRSPRDHKKFVRIGDRLGPYGDKHRKAQD